MKRRASVMIYVLIMITVMALVMAAYVNVSGAAMKTQTARERDYAATCALEAALLATSDDLYNAKITTSSAPSYAPAAGTVTVSMVDNTGSVTRTVAVTASINYKTKTYRLTRIIGKRTATPVPNVYALFSDQDLTLSGSKLLTTNSAMTGGAVYCHGDIQSASHLNAAGDVECTGEPSGIPVYTGSLYKNCPGINFPTVNLLNYSSLGIVLIILYALTGLNLGNSYATKYFGTLGTLQYEGSLAGQGSVAGGSMDISGDIAYSDGSAVAAFIMTKNITVESAATRIDGFYFCNGTFKTNGPVTVNGTVACSKLDLGGPLTINYDSRIWTDETLAGKLRLPGAFP